MANLYQRFDFVIRTKGGAVAAGAPLTVRRLSDNALANIYSGDNLAGALPNPIYSDTNGVITFFAGDLTDDYTFTLPGDLTWSVAGAAADTVHNHRTTGVHSDGTITANQLEDGIIGNTTDVAIHEAKVRDVHGVPNTLGTEGFAYSTVGGATNSPTFDTVVVDGLDVVESASTPGKVLGANVIQNPVSHLASAVQALEHIVLPAGTFTMTSPVDLDTCTHLRGQGEGMTILNFNNSSYGLRVNHPNGPVRIEGMTINNLGSGTGITVADAGANANTGAFIRDLKATSSSGPAMTYANNAGGGMFSGCMFQSTNSAMTYTSTGGSRSTSFVGCIFEGPVSFTATGDAGGEGSTVTNCHFTSTLAVDTPNVKFLGNRIAGNVTVSSTAVPCLLPDNGNLVGGTLTDSTYIKGFASWDYSSAWIDVDNSGSAQTDRFFKVGTTGIGGVFNHNLGTKQLEYMVQVSENSGGGGRRWTIMGGVIPQGVADMVPAYEAFGINIRDSNNVDLIMYAGDHQASGGATASSTKTIFVTPDTTALQTVARNAYNYNAAGGDALDRVWVKLFLRKAL